MTVAISICNRCRRFQSAELWGPDADFEEAPWLLTETRCQRCDLIVEARHRLKTLPIRALLGLLAFGGFGLVLSLV